MLFTIGYTAFQIKDFIETLKQHEINALIDVRSLPYSEYYAEYNKENLKHMLAVDKIYYRNYANEFGARQTEKQYFSHEGYLDFELFTQSESFAHGYDKVIDSLTQGYNIALMCAEKDPETCHRTIMISRVFHQNGHLVKHLLAGGDMEGQDDVEQRLLDKYFPNRNQLSLFEDPPKEELLRLSYQKRNAEIGYRLGDDDE